MAAVMTVKEVARYLHVHPVTVYRLLKRAVIPAFRIGGDWRFNVESIDQWRAEREKMRGLDGYESSTTEGDPSNRRGRQIIS